MFPHRRPARTIPKEKAIVDRKVFKDVAEIYLERGFTPIPAKQKRPVPAGATGRNGTVTPEKVSDWTNDPEWSGQNTAIRMLPTHIGIDVDDYANKHGAQQLAELEAKLGPLPATPSSTSRGKNSQSRQYFLELPEPILLVGKAAPDIDIIQASHRYSLVWPSRNPDAYDAPYVWYDAEGKSMSLPPYVAEFEMLPDAWIEYLRADEREFDHASEQWDGEIPTEASDAEVRKLRTIVSRLEGLPDVWSAGAGWHDTVFAAACWLARIARSNAYLLTEVAAEELLLAHTPVYPDWGREKVVEQWESAWKTTVGQFEEPPLETRPPLLPWTEFPLDKTFPQVDGDSFAAAWNTRPLKDEPSHLWLRRHRMLVELLKCGIDEQEAATLVWHSAAARGNPIVFDGQAYDDPDSKCITERELWREVDQAREAVEKASGAGIEAAPDELRPSLYRHDRVPLLTDAERAVERPWFGADYLTWAESTFPYLNKPYWRANRWVILSVCLSDIGLLPKEGGIRQPLNLYIATAGETTSGKTEASRPVDTLIDSVFPGGDTPDVGGDHTPESLNDILISRGELDCISTFFHPDEAHTHIQEWKKPNGYASRMKGVVTQVYDGMVSPIYRVTRKENNGKRARAAMTAHLMGTKEGFIDVIEPSDWASGFINRFLWVIGDPVVRTKESMTGGWITKDRIDTSAEQDPIRSAPLLQQWAAQLQGARMKVVHKHAGRPALIGLTDETLTRFNDFKWELQLIAAQKPRFQERLVPTFIRLADATLRAAALVALSEARTDLTMDDLLIAIEQAEEWATNTLIMVEATAESFRDRKVNEVEAAVRDHGGYIVMRDLHLAFPNRKREIEDYVNELVAQGRVGLEKSKDGVEGVRYKKALSVQQDVAGE